jgi:hypothetical protein
MSLTLDAVKNNELSPSLRRGAREEIFVICASLRRTAEGGSHGHDFVSDSHAAASQDLQSNSKCAQLGQNIEIDHRHDVGFYSDDIRRLDDLTQFIGAALKAGNAAIVAATESHRESLLPRLQAHGLDIGTALEQGRYAPLDAADTFSAFMHNGMPDPVLFANLWVISL